MHTCIHVFSILSFRDDIKLKFVALVTFRCLHEAMTSYDVKKTQLFLKILFPINSNIVKSTTQNTEGGLYLMRDYNKLQFRRNNLP